MHYSDITKRFWKTGYRLFHGKFLYFMGGPKSYGQSETSEKGSYTADKALINFAVPSLPTISSFNIGDCEVTNFIPPGILSPVLKCLQSATETEFMLCADGKKVTSGIDPKGDVGMFSFEDGITFSERKAELKSQLLLLESVSKLTFNIENETKLKHLDVEVKEQMKSKMLDIVTVVGSRMKDCRQLANRQRLGMEKFKAMAGEKWRDSRYVYVISGLQASLFQLSEFVVNALSSIGTCMKLASHLQETLSEYVEEDTVEQSCQLNLLNLVEEDDQMTCVVKEPQYVKQRSCIWHTLRKSAHVTGITLYSAISLRGLKEQKKHFGKFLLGEEDTVSPETQQRLEHGSKNEIHAVATITGRLLPAFFPNLTFIEEGCYILPGKNTDILGVVSPDGSLATLERDTEGRIENIKKLYAIEIKCPFPVKNRLPVHYLLPEYYACQCLAEMNVLNTEQLLYVTYSKESTTILKVEFDEHLWQTIWNEVSNIYDVDDPRPPTKGRHQTKELKLKIKEFIEKKVEFICEIPSTFMCDNGLHSRVEGSPFLSPCHGSMNRTKVESTIKDVDRASEISKNVVENSYNLLRKRASEVMVWILTNKNRNSTLD